MGETSSCKKLSRDDLRSKVSLSVGEIILRPENDHDGCRQTDEENR